MGAFLISRNNVNKNIVPALDLFVEMGFSKPTTLQICEWTIYVYHKMSVNSSNMVSDKGCTLISIGTPIYRGLDYTSSLDAILNDYLSGSINNEFLIGQYTLIFCCKNTIEILCDSLGCKHLFTDKTHSILSSHMLPICQYYSGNLSINRKAFYEKLLTGIIMPPNTLFIEVNQIDKQVAEYITNENIGIKFIRTTGLHTSEFKKKTFKECISEQADTLREYFELLSNAGKNGIDVGLSGGYDSRLVLACLNQFVKERKHLHSHATENIHQMDLSIANQMANYVGVPCHSVVTKKLIHCDHLDDVLRKSILYFDGRSSFSIGGCGEVYTASYRQESTEETPFTLTGVGGELYRNVFSIGARNIHFDHFMKEKVFSQSLKKALPEKLYNEISNDIINRSARRLGINPKHRQSKTIAHRYYCEIMMPDGQGVALDAYNQVSCCVAPFLEPRIIEKGYEAIPFHHSGGDFEGKLINLIDPGLAAIPSSYGYPINKRPARARIKENLRSFIPLSIWNRLALIANKKGEIFSIKSALDKLLVKNRTIEEAYSFITELFPEINFTYLLHSDEDIRRLQFVAISLYYCMRGMKSK